MKFALVDGERREAEPKLIGRCPGCGEVVTARCGTQRVKHWAHKGRLMCDPWWEPETEWHRAWKNLFPVSWQEVPLRSEETSELHIADIKTPSGLVIEFQHSAIRPEERGARENFYRWMLWVVDGTRLMRDRPRMDENLPNWRKLPEGIVQTTHWPAEIFPQRWLECAVPVLFDFNGLSDDPEYEQDDPLICLLPHRFMDKAVYFPVRRVTLEKIANDKAGLFDWRTVHIALFERQTQSLKARRRF